VTKEKGLISGSERQVNKETERSDIGVTQGEGLVCGIEKQVFMLEFGMILTMSSLKYQQISLCFGHWYSLADCWVCFIYCT
jgi:hypothetical protein